MPRSPRAPRRPRSSAAPPLLPGPALSASLRHDDLAAHGVHLTFGTDPATSMVVSWITREPVERPRVQVHPEPPGTDDIDNTDDADDASDAGDAGGADTDDPEAVRRAGAAANGRLVEGRLVDAVTRSYTDSVTGEVINAHHARLDGLEPDTVHRYEITWSPAGGREPGEETVRALGGAFFRTAPHARVPFTFTCFGDHGTDAPDDPFGSPASATLVAGLERVAPLFTLVNGDLAYSNIRDVPPRAWSDWFAMISPSARRRPWMPSVGNHETERGNGALGLAAYQAYFQPPGNGEEPYLDGLWYAFTVGGVRFVVLCGDDVCYQDVGRVYLRGFSAGRQTAWLEQELKQARADREVDWIIVALHQPAVSTSEFHNGADLGLREAWLPLFDQYGVDLVLCGHEHHYERTHSVRGVIEGSPTRTPRPVPPGEAAAEERAAGVEAATGTVTVDTAAGTVHMLLGTGGSSSPSAHHLFDPPACRVVVGVREPEPGHRHRPPIHAVEPAPWLATRAADHPYAFAAFAVDPGTPGGTTSIQVTVYDSSAAEPVPFDTFTLTRPRGDAG